MQIFRLRRWAQRLCVSYQVLTVATGAVTVVELKTLPGNWAIWLAWSVCALVFALWAEFWARIADAAP